MTALHVVIGISGWIAFMLVIGAGAGKLIKARAAHLDENAVRDARDGIGWPKL